MLHKTGWQFLRYHFVILSKTLCDRRFIISTAATIKVDKFYRKQSEISIARAYRNKKNQYRESCRTWRRPDGDWNRHDGQEMPIAGSNTCDLQIPRSRRRWTREEKVNHEEGAEAYSRWPLRESRTFGSSTKRLLNAQRRDLFVVGIRSARSDSTSTFSTLSGIKPQVTTLYREGARVAELFYGNAVCIASRGIHPREALRASTASISRKTAETNLRIHIL